MISTRRAFLTGMVSLIASPAIVRASSLMPVKIIKPEIIQINYGIARTGGGVCLSRISELLLPGLRKIVLDDEKYTKQWEETFR
jgi:hypothetical protein